MTIRRKLLLFIPLLVLLVNLVTFFLFQSGKIVQESYGVMMDRILLYNQSSQTADRYLQQLYGYLINPDAKGPAVLEQQRNELEGQRKLLSAKGTVPPSAVALNDYVHMLSTLIEQEQASLAAAQLPSPGTALAYYDKAERTAGFIREEAQQLVDEELRYYQPVYKQIQEENVRMNRLGAAVFIVNTLLSIAVAFWISRSITEPVSRLVGMARHIAKGRLDTEPPSLSSKDELGILSDAFRQMLADLKLLIERDKLSLEKDRLVRELELQALQSQMNPHFLFNTLNALSKLALLEGAEQASDLIVSMSNLLRYNLRRLDQPVTLRDELQHVKEYFTIQKARFRDRVSFETDIDESALGIPIPALTVQPLVENAFVHGIEGMERGAVIRLDIRGKDDEIWVSVTDNGVGMSEEIRQSLLRLEAESTRTQSTGLGTRNVFKRLELFFGRSDLVDIRSVPNQGTTVTIRIPIREESEHPHVPAVDRG